MPRLPRIDVPGLTYHITNRGVKKLPIFLDDDDRQSFVRLILLAKELFPFSVQAFSLMTNHFHLLIKTAEASISQIMQYVTGRYAQQFNRRHHQVGHAFQSRFHSIPVQTDAYLLTASSYIDLNAVRAGIVEKPEDYLWSSYRWTVSGKRHPLSNPRDVLALLSDTEERARVLYRQYTMDWLQKPEPITQEKLLKLRSWGSLPLIFEQARERLRAQPSY
jgi:putative transposase